MTNENPNTEGTDDVPKEKEKELTEKAEELEDVQ